TVQVPPASHKLISGTAGLADTGGPKVIDTAGDSAPNPTPAPGSGAADPAGSSAAPAFQATAGPGPGSILSFLIQIDFFATAPASAATSGEASPLEGHTIGAVAFQVDWDNADSPGSSAQGQITIQWISSPQGPTTLATPSSSGAGLTDGGKA